MLASLGYLVRRSKHRCIPEITTQLIIAMQNLALQMRAKSILGLNISIFD